MHLGPPLYSRIGVMLLAFSQKQGPNAKADLFPFPTIASLQTNFENI